MYLQTSYNQKVLTAGDMSLASVTSTAVDVNQVTTVAFQTNVVSGTGTGQVIVQVSLDGILFQDFETNSINLNGQASLFFGYTFPPFTKARVKYVKTSGTGSIDVICTMKGMF